MISNFTRSSVDTTIKVSVKGSARLIRQMISIKVTSTSDVGLIKKCNKEDAQKVIRYAKSLTTIY